MAVVSGVDGAISYTNGYVTKVNNWVLNIEAEDVDITALGDAWASHQGGLRRWSGTYDSMVDAAILSSATASDPTLGNIKLGGTAATATFSFNSSRAFSGSILVTGADVTNTVGGGATTLTFTFVGSGALTIT